MNADKPIRLRVSLSHFLVLITWIAMGFAPLQWWRSRQPPAVHAVSVHVANLRTEDLRELGLPQDGSEANAIISDIEELLQSIKKIDESDRLIRLYSTTLMVTEGHFPRILNGGGIDIPVLQPDGTVAVVERYDGEIIRVKPQDLSNGNILLLFDITSQCLDCQNPTTVADTKTYPQFTRQLQAQVEIPKGKYIAISAGRRKDGNGEERKLVFLLSGEKAQR